MLIAGIVSPSMIRSTGIEWSLLSDHRSTPNTPWLDQVLLYKVNKKDLQALTLVKPARENFVLDPLAVQLLNTRLYIMY